MTKKSTITFNASDFSEQYGFGDGHSTYYVDCILADGATESTISNAILFIDCDGNSLEALENDFIGILTPPNCVYRIDESGNRIYGDDTYGYYVYGEFSDDCSEWTGIACYDSDNEELAIYESETGLWWMNEDNDTPSWISYKDGKKFVYVDCAICWLDEAGNIRNDDNAWHGLEIHYYSFAQNEPGAVCFLRSDGVQWCPLEGYYVINPSNNKKVYIDYSIDNNGIVYFDDDNAGYDPEGERCKTNSDGRIQVIWDEENNCYRLFQHGGARPGSGRKTSFNEGKVQVSYTIPKSIEKLVKKDSLEQGISSSEVVSLILTEHYNK